MKASIITSAGSNGMVVLQGQLTASQIHDVAEGFIQGAPDSALRKRLRRTFGKWNARKYCLDFTGPVYCRITFSVSPQPDVVSYKGSPVAIAHKHASSLEILITVTDLERIESSAVRARPFNAGE